MMGHRRFFDQIILDEIQRQGKKIVDEIDVTSLKEYMQYVSHLDEMPAYLGGRDNSWRKLSLQGLPRTTIIYDIVEYAETGSLSDRLRGELPRLLVRPLSQDMLLLQLRAVSKLRAPWPLCTDPPCAPLPPSARRGARTGPAGKQPR
ncbi:UNVERIFIED_CONTAM: hypothetical protein FKN15_005007 [Acipenser sinensis]